MKVFVKGGGEISLTQNDFLASGGEASIYAKGKTAYKIYHDPKKMIPTAKIQELSVLANNYIIKPEHILLDAKNKPIGYDMKLIPDSYSLCQIFPKAFRQRENLSHKQVFGLVRCIQDIVKYCHDNHIIVADLNEMNVILDKKFNNAYLIDMDSVKTPSFPPTALMESIRDRHNPNIFNEGTDWFAFAIIAFSSMIGIHPYKGKHPSLKTLDERMMKNVSVMNPSVSMPQVCYDLNIIPPNYMKWFDAVLEQGKRVAPPFGSEFIQTVVAKIKTIVGNNKFDITELKDFVHTISAYFSYPGNELVMTDATTVLNGKELTGLDGFTAVGITSKKNHAICAKVDMGSLKLFDINAQKELEVNIMSQSIMAYRGTLYSKLNGHITEIDFIETGANIVPTSKVICQTMENATYMFDGVVFQNMLGAYYATVFPKPGFSYQVHIKELKAYIKIIDAKFDNGLLIVVAVDAKGRTDELIMRFDERYENYDIRKNENITFIGLNWIVLDNGVCVMINQQEHIEIFSTRMGSAGIKLVEDPIISSDMKLYKNGTQVLFANGTKLYTMKMK